MIRSSIRLNFISLIALSATITLVLITIALIWVKNSRTAEGLQAQIKELESENFHTEKVITSTYAYVRILEATQFSAYGQLTNEELIEITEELWKISRSYSFDPLLILALVTVESQGDPAALGKYRSGKLSGALGLMQIKMGTAQSMAKHLGIGLRTHADLMNPKINILFGATYLIKMILRYKSLRYGIMAYNVGPGTLNKAIRTKSFTKLPVRYYNRLLSNYNGLVKRFGSQASMGISQ
ncbi:MAG: transglycosylase SLT domain-containing protein [Fibrobacterales bacterium]